MKSKKYPNLMKPGWSKNWVFRKYSSAKKAEFSASTGFPAIESNASKAYQHGLEKFNAWLGVHMTHGRQPLIRDFARVVLASKKSKKAATALKARVEIERHINPFFGHLRADQVTSLRLNQYEADQRALGRNSLFNTRKILMEILMRARDEGVIRALPVWKLSDPKPAPPRFISEEVFNQIHALCVGPEKLVLFILYHQGARPREVLNYRWDMISWGAGEAVLNIPASITKTKRARSIPLNSHVLHELAVRRQDSGPLFPSRSDPDKPRAVYDREWFKAIKALGLDFAVYNLRDSFITRKLQEGLGSIFIAKYVDTSAVMVERKYAVPVTEVMKRVAG